MSTCKVFECLSASDARGLCKTHYSRWRRTGTTDARVAAKFQREKSIWRQMKSRCSNPNNTSYESYGAAGINVAERWLDFEKFIFDMGPAPEGFTLERLDNAKGYEPGNVIWADRYVQNNNTSRNRMIEFDGETKTMAQWVRDSRCEVSYSTLESRLRRGWEICKAMRL